VIALLLAPGNVLSAQLAGGLSLDGGVGQVGSSAWLRQSRLSPSLRYASPFGAVHADGLLSERAGVISLDRASLAGLLASPVVGGFRLSADGAFERDGISTPAVARVSPALSYRYGRVGGWVGSAHEQRLAPALHAGVFTSIRSAVLSVSSRTTSTTSHAIVRSVVTDSVRNHSGEYDRFRRVLSDTSTSSDTRWSQLDARFDWSAGRLALTGTWSASFSATARRDSAGTRAMRWGRVNASYQLNHRLGLIAGVGTSPAATSSRAKRFATLGVRIAPAMFAREPLAAPVRPSAASFSVKPIEPGIYKVVLRVPVARSVELSGDFNRWSAVAMTQTAAGVWEATIALAPGTHRVNVRIDGDAWTAPPGLPAVNDEFSGRVGILVIR
jgi:hypothetical protein